MYTWRVLVVHWGSVSCTPGKCQGFMIAASGGSGPLALLICHQGKSPDLLWFEYLNVNLVMITPMKSQLCSNY